MRGSRLRVMAVTATLAMMATACGSPEAEPTSTTLAPEAATSTTAPVESTTTTTEAGDDNLVGAGRGGDLCDAVRGFEEDLKPDEALDGEVRAGSLPTAENLEEISEGIATMGDAVPAEVAAEITEAVANFRAEAFLEACEFDMTVGKVGGSDYLKVMVAEVASGMTDIEKDAVGKIISLSHLLVFGPNQHMSNGVGPFDEAGEGAELFAISYDFGEMMASQVRTMVEQMGENPDEIDWSDPAYEWFDEAWFGEMVEVPVVAFVPGGETDLLVAVMSAGGNFGMDSSMGVEGSEEPQTMLAAARLVGATVRDIMVRVLTHVAETR